MKPMTCRLPGGYVDADGVLHQEAVLTPLSGREEEFLADPRPLASAALVTTILSQCLCRLGTISPVDEEIARRLLVADRQFLLLKLREATFGDQVQATIRCPWPNCGKSVDIDFSIPDIPIVESKEKGPIYTMTLSAEAAYSNQHGDVVRKLAFRLPNGEDQEAVSPLLSDNEAWALTMLLKRCIQDIGSVASHRDVLIEALSPQARLEIERQMEAVAPKVELTMEAPCPECGRTFAAPFDLQDFFFGELRTSRDLLYREVHYLAYYYHWSEQEIMSMSREKRRRYIDVLADEIERLNDAD